MKSYRAWSPTQSFLLPPSPLEWLPEGHLAQFVLEVAQTLDLSAIEGAIQEKDGQRNFTDPDSRIMVKGGEFLQGYNAQAAVDAFRGLQSVRAEWSFVCATHYLLKLFRGGFRPLLAAAQA